MKIKELTALIDGNVSTIYLKNSIGSGMLINDDLKRITDFYGDYTVDRIQNNIYYGGIDIYITVNYEL